MDRPNSGMGLFVKLAMVQHDVEGVEKSADNPYFSSKYATFEMVIAALRPSLEKYSLLIVHRVVPGSEDGYALLHTVIHDLQSEEELQSSYPLALSANPQKMGSQITYAKRYNVVALFNLSMVEEDDDGAFGAGLSKPTGADALLAKLKS